MTVDMEVKESQRHSMSITETPITDSSIEYGFQIGSK